MRKGKKSDTKILWMDNQISKVKITEPNVSNNNNKKKNKKKWYIHNQVSVLENETHKTVWDFGIQTDHLISARQQVLVMVNNKKKKRKKKGNLPKSESCRPG